MGVGKGDADGETEVEGLVEGDSDLVAVRDADPDLLPDLDGDGDRVPDLDGERVLVELLVAVDVLLAETSHLMPYQHHD